MWELDCKEGWMPKNWCFWTVVLKKILRVPWTARRSSQSILNEISPEYSLEGLMLELQYSGHLMQRTISLEKPLMLGKVEGQRRRGQQRMRRLDSITNSMDMNLSKLQEIVEDRGVCPATVTVGHSLGTEQQQQKNQTWPSLWREWSNAVIIQQSTFLFFWSCMSVVCF